MDEASEVAILRGLMVRLVGQEMKNGYLLMTPDRLHVDVSIRLTETEYKYLDGLMFDDA